MITTRQAYCTWHRRCRETPHSFIDTLTVINGRQIGMHRVGRLKGYVQATPDLAPPINSPREQAANHLWLAAAYRRDIERGIRSDLAMAQYHVLKARAARSCYA